jgi:two-component system CheB/CheR fusion protein
VLGELTPLEREVQSTGNRWHLMRLRPYRTLDDRIDGVVVTFVDITERKQAEHRLRLMTAELDHRVKNVLARIASLIERAGERGGSLEDAVHRLEAQVQAMGRTHVMLSQARWVGVPLNEIFAAELGLQIETGSVVFSGAEVTLNGDAAQALTMVVHELATNALKHGALSVGKGRVRIEAVLTGPAGGAAPACSRSTGASATDRASARRATKAMGSR